MVVAVAVIFAFSFLGGTKGGGEIFLQNASAAGPDPFTPSTAGESGTAVTPTITPNESSAPGGTLKVSGAHPGLYSGKQNESACDVEKQIAYLTKDPARTAAFADTLKVEPQDLPSHLRALTPVQLNWDTRVTSHGFKDGQATDYQAILQAGTPVMVDDHGVPVVRCTCGNPLSSPDAVNGTPTYSGRQWDTFRAAGLVAVVPSDKPMMTLTLYDQDSKRWFERPSGKVEGKQDHKVEPPRASRPAPRCRSFRRRPRARSWNRRGRRRRRRARRRSRRSPSRRARRSSRRRRARRSRRRRSPRRARSRRRRKGNPRRRKSRRRARSSRRRRNRSPRSPQARRSNPSPRPRPTPRNSPRSPPPSPSSPNSPNSPNSPGPAQVLRRRRRDGRPAPATATPHPAQVPRQTQLRHRRIEDRRARGSRDVNAVDRLDA